MQPARKWVRFSILVTLLGSVMGQSKCPNYNKPDDTGALPAGTPPTAQRYQEKTSQNPPDPLTCDTAVYQTISVSQTGVNCDVAFNYTTLFNQAKAIADGIASVTRCPNANCSPVHMWIERLSFDCQGTTAGVLLEIGLLCPRANTVKPPGIQMAAINPVINGFPVQLPNPPPPPKPSIGDVTAQVATAPVSCVPVQFVEYRYREPAACAGNFNYRPYVDRAERRAGEVCGAVTCAAGCVPCTPPKIARSQWGCRNGNEVDITVHVQCCK